MKDVSKIFMTVLASTIGLSGCYTQMMTPQEFVETQREKSIAHSDASSSLNYNQNCYSCHSKAELDDRYVDWKYYGITTAHNGVGLDPMAWNNPYSAPVYEPDPYGWYTPAPSQPWWLPPAVIVKNPTTVAPGASSKPENRSRTDGSTRDKRGENPRSEPIPAQAQPSGGNTSTAAPSTPPPTVTTTQPAQTPPASTTSSSERSKSDSGSSNTNRPRNDGSTRDKRSR